MSAEQDLANANVQIANLISEVTRFRDAAMGINNLWPTITEGLNNTADGKYFSVPGGGAYMRLYRRNGSSQTLIAEFPDRAELNSVIDQLGPLLGRGVVGGAGDLMAKGAYGIGTERAPNLIDVNAINDESGLYRVVAGTLNRTSLPGGGGLGCMIINRLSPTLLTQIWTELATGRVFSRSFDTDVWRNWVIGYDRNNIIGTVSQSGGVPTGAIIESGSNANGRYTKLADGTLVCSFYRDDGSGLGATAEGPVYTSGTLTIPDYPHAFVSVPNVSFSITQRNGYSLWGTVGGRPTSTSPGGGYRYMSGDASSARVGQFQYIAIGRWY